MVMTAADAQHPSFGCEDRAKWTYFGDAFFNVALRRADNLQDAFARARTLVREREDPRGIYSIEQTNGRWRECAAPACARDR